MQIPMGLLADKKGMKVALVLNIISTILYWGWLPLVGMYCVYLSAQWLRCHSRHYRPAKVGTLHCPCIHLYRRRSLGIWRPYFRRYQPKDNC